MVCYPQNGGTIVLKMVVFAVVVDCFSMNYNRRQINNYKTKIKQLKTHNIRFFPFLRPCGVRKMCIEFSRVNKYAFPGE